MNYYDTFRELLTEDMRDIEHLLGVLTGVTDDNTMTERMVIIALTRAIYHVLAYAVRVMEKERRRNNDRV